MHFKFHLHLFDTERMHHCLFFISLSFILNACCSVIWEFCKLTSQENQFSDFNFDFHDFDAVHSYYFKLHLKTLEIAFQRP